MYLSIIALVISGISLAVSVVNLKRVGDLEKKTAHKNEIVTDEAIRQLRVGLEESLVKTFGSNDAK